MIGIEQAEQVLDILTEWGYRTQEVRALWLTGSFAVGTADRFSDIDLRGCIESEEFNWFASAEEALADIPGLFVLKRRGFSQTQPDSELVVDFPGGICLDFHVVTPDRLNGSYFDPYPIRILIDKGCNLTQLYASARCEHKSQKPADEKTRISRAVLAWTFLGHAVAATKRGQHSYALSLLMGARVAFAHVLLGRTEAIAPYFSPVLLPKFLPPEDHAIIDATTADAAIALIPQTIEVLGAALRDQSADLEKSDATGRLARMRSSVEALMQREGFRLAGVTGRNKITQGWADQNPPPVMM